LASTIQRRQRKTPDGRAKRTAQYRKERRGERVLLEQLTEAMNFTFVGESTRRRREVKEFQNRIPDL
jgi:hypothetical protein